MLTDLPSDKAFDTNVIKVVNSFLAKDLRDLGFQVITPTDIGAALGLERQKQILGCTESSCLAEIGGAMGADYIVHGEMAALERDTALTLTLTDTHGQALNQVGEVVKGKEAQGLLEAVNRDVPKLVRPILDSGKISAAQPEVAAPAGGLVATAPASAAPEESHRGSYILYGVGAAGLVVAGVFGGLSYSSYQTYNSDSAAGQNGKLSGDQSTSNTMAAVAWGGLAVAVVGASIGTYLLLSHSTPAPATSP
jgi:hypothetical protein